MTGAYVLRCRRSGLKFRRAFSQQVLRLEWPLAGRVTLYNHLDTRTENVRHDPTVGHRQALSTLCDHKGDELLLIISYNRTLLHNASHTHRLRRAGGTVLEFAHRHIVDSVRLCISVHEVDYRC